MNTTAMRMRKTRTEHTRPAVRTEEGPRLESAIESGAENRFTGALTETNTQHTISALYI